MVNSGAKVMTGGRMSGIFKIASGVKQGDALSALLFNLAGKLYVKAVSYTHLDVYKRQPYSIQGRNTFS